MKRKDAEIAVKELDGLDWGGSIIRVGWSKMVKIPLRPIFGKSKCSNSMVPRGEDEMWLIQSLFQI